MSCSDDEIAFVLSMERVQHDDEVAVFCDAEQVSIGKCADGWRSLKDATVSGIESNRVSDSGSASSIDGIAAPLPSLLWY